MSGVLRLEVDRPIRLVVLRALQLGDLLCSVPALRALRGLVPAAHIALVGLPWARDFVDRFSVYLDEFIEFPGWPSLPERDVDLRAVPPFLTAIQERSFDLAIQMHGDGTTTNSVVALFGARRIAGFRLPGRPVPGNAHLVLYPSWLPEVRRHLYLLEQLGAVAPSEDLEFPVRETEEREWRALRAAVGLGGSYACVHAGARDAGRRWSVEGFAAVARSLAQRGLTPVLTGSGDEEQRLAAEIARTAGVRLVDLAGRTSLGVLAAAIASAAIVVCNDTGVSHLADSLGVASVVVFRTTDPATWAPLDARLHRAVQVQRHPAAVPRVLAAVDVLLEGEGRRAA